MIGDDVVTELSKSVSSDVAILAIVVLVLLLRSNNARKP